MILLSIIVPFYNAQNKASKLLGTLSKIEGRDIELIFVDDGSTDKTLQMLKEFKNENGVMTKVIVQENKGPGGARNTGLKNAAGKYVWFVDADDDINPEAIELVRKISDKNYDFIEFEVYTETNNVSPTPVKEGEYTDIETVRKLLFLHISILTNKCVRRSTLVENELFYPEYCFYEDNPMVLLYPLYFKSFYKSNMIGYYQYKHDDSISRSEISDRYFDRMATMEWGFHKAMGTTDRAEEREIIYKRFTRVYLLGTTGILINQKQWLTAMRVYKNYRKIRHQYHIKTDPLKFWDFSLLSKTKFWVFWYLSFLLPDQTDYFLKIHERAWKRSKPDTNNR